jgi:type I restriction enzyme R subunit
LDLPTTDDVDILAKVGFQLIRVPTRHQRVERFWEDEDEWLQALLSGAAGSPRDVIRFPGRQQLAVAAEEREAYGTQPSPKLSFWQTALDHYALFGIDDLEQARTYGAPQFAALFGSFQSLTSQYGGAQLLKGDLEAVKRHLYVPMSA